MTQEIKRRRGTTAQHASFTGAEAELTVDTDKNVAVIHDGETAGGFPMAREDLTNVPNAAHRQKYRSPIDVKNGASPYAAEAADRGKTFVVTEEATVELQAAATLGDGWFLNVMARGGDVTIEPDGAEEIEGEAGYTVKDGTDATIRCDGTGFRVAAGGGSVDALFEEDLGKSGGEQAQARANIGADILGGFRNKLINALGTINQRGYASGAATSGANQYTVDRWRVVTSGQNLSWTESDGVCTFTAPAGGVEQVIEGGAILSGDYVLNWEGTATATVNGTPRAKGEVFSLTGAADVTVRFSGGTFSLPQLERGTSPTPFEPHHPQQELALCQRYFEIVHTFVFDGSPSVTTSVYRLSANYRQVKRATPTLSHQDNGGSGGFTGASISPSGVSNTEVMATFVGPTGTSAGRLDVVTQADAEL